MPLEISDIANAHAKYVRSGIKKYCQCFIVLFNWISFLFFKSIQKYRFFFPGMALLVLVIDFSLHVRLVESNCIGCPKSLILQIWPFLVDHTSRPAFICKIKACMHLIACISRLCYLGHYQCDEDLKFRTLKKVSHMKPST